MAENLATMLTNITSVVTEAFDWVTLAGGAILESPILFTFACAIPVVGLGVALFRRLAGNL